jgi:Raf kinase inhibitor-like YbhB/YbcL family protein
MLRSSVNNKTEVVLDKDTGPKASFEVISPVFRNGAHIPKQYTSRGQNVNPPFNFFNAPPKTQSLTLVMHDADAVSGDFLHWLVWDIPPSTDVICVNDVPVGAIQGKNGIGQNGYFGPAPPKGTGTHHYVFDFYALDTTLDLPFSSSLEDVMKAQEDHILSQYSITGTFAAET